MNNLFDTAIACEARGKNPFRYTYGKEEPNYPMPAIAMKLDVTDLAGKLVLGLYSLDDNQCFAFWFNQTELD